MMNFPKEIGVSPTEIVADTEFVTASITLILLSFALATYKLVPSVLKVKPRGPFPTGIDPLTLDKGEMKEDGLKSSWYLVH